MPQRVQVAVPDLGLNDQAIRIAVCYVQIGAAVSRGETLIQLAAGPVAVELEAPEDGCLVRMFVSEDDEVDIGDLLAEIETD